MQDMQGPHAGIEPMEPVEPMECFGGTGQGVVGQTNISKGCDDGNSLRSTGLAARI